MIVWINNWFHIVFIVVLDKHFPRHNKFHKIFYRNTVKISYNYMRNMKIIINSDNHKTTSPKTITKERTCNCVHKAKCLLSQNCFIYKHHLQSTSTNVNQPTLQRGNPLRHSWNYNQAAILKPPKIM